MTYQKAKEEVIESSPQKTDAGKEELSFILEKTEKDIFGLLQQKGNSEFTPISVVAENVFEMIDKASRTNETVTGVPTGFFDLDFKTSGFQASDLVLHTDGMYL